MLTTINTTRRGSGLDRFLAAFVFALILEISSAIFLSLFHQRGFRPPLRKKREQLATAVAAWLFSLFDLALSAKDADNEKPSGRCGVEYQRRCMNGI